MKGLLRSLFAFIVMGFFASNVWAAKPKILQLKNLEPGTHAIGFSVFKGVEPRSFDVELGGPTDYMGNSLILSRVSGGPMDTLLEEIGAIAGMSGSPVFIGNCKELQECITKAPLDGNDVFLVGSTSYGPGSFIKGGPNFLLTPAEYMLGSRTGGYVAAAQFLNRMPNKINIGNMEFINLMLFPKLDNLAAQGKLSGKCGESFAGSELKPGSMITVFLADGLIHIGASGTVTWRDEDKIYVFGHPLFGTGVVNYPFVHVAVADTIQTPINPYKIPGCFLNTKGTILVDGAFEIAGMIGRTASMLSYQVELYMGNGGAILSEEIAASPMAPAIIQRLPVIWAEQLLGDVSHFSLAYQARISIVNQPEIFVRNIVPVQISKNPFEEVFARVYGPIQNLKKSGFDYEIEGIKIRLDVIKNFGLWSVKKSFLSQEKASPGETVYANVVLEELFSSATKQISIPIKVPEDFMDRGTSPANITVLIQSGNKFTDKRESVEIISVEDLVKQLNRVMNYKANVLYVQQIMPRSKAEQKADEANIKALAKPSWKWIDVGESDLKQFPRNDKNEVVLTLSPALNDFIDLNLIFNLEVQPKKDTATEKKDKASKHRKWYLLFLS